MTARAGADGGRKGVLVAAVEEAEDSTRLGADGAWRAVAVVLMAQPAGIGSPAGWRGRLHRPVLSWTWPYMDRSTGRTGADLTLNGCGPDAQLAPVLLLLLPAAAETEGAGSYRMLKGSGRRRGSRSPGCDGETD